MWKGNLRCLGIAIIFLLYTQFVLSVIISEVELNPAGTDIKNEWVELYSKEQVDLAEYKLVNGDGEEVILSGILEGYLTWTFKNQWLDNEGEKVSLYRGNDLISETIILKDIFDSGKTWNFCSSEWVFVEGTKDAENKCLPEDFSENNEKDKINKTTTEDEDREEGNIKKDGNEIIYENTTYTNAEEKNNQSNIIYLVPKSIKTGDESEVLFKSNNQKIKEYAIYGFALFCILLIILLVIDRKSK